MNSNHENNKEADTRIVVSEIDSKKIPIKVWGLVVLLLCVFAIQAQVASYRDSVTIDEFCDLPIGLYMLKTGDLSLDPINPSLPRMFSALPVLMMSPNIDFSGKKANWGTGYKFMFQNPERYHDFFLAARIPIILLGVLLGLLLFYWGNALSGWRSALCALFLFSFSPSMLTHFHLVTLDGAGALGFFSVAYASWRFLGKPTWRSAVVVGIALGIAPLLKLSALILPFLVLMFVVIHVVTERIRGKMNLPSYSRWFALLSIIAVVSLFVLNAGYGFQGFFSSLKPDVFFKNGWFSFLIQNFPWLRLPLPASLLIGVDKAMNQGRMLAPSYFLAGQLSATGWWYYHLVAFACKTPLPLILMLIVAFSRWVVGLENHKRAYCIYLPIVFVFGANSLFNSMCIGVRHALAVYPFMFLIVAPLFAEPLRDLSKFKTICIIKRMKSISSLLLLVWFFLGGLRVAPDYFQYFNELAGGPENGYKILIDSNMDWGQDLIRLREFMQANNIKQVNFAYFGRVHPGIYGINFVPLDNAEQKGITVISASFLMGRPFFWFRNGKFEFIEPNVYKCFRDRKPFARVGALFIFKSLSEDPQNNHPSRNLRK